MSNTVSIKSLYSTPHLTVHGNVETLTMGGGAGHGTRPVGGGGGNGYGYGHCRNAGNPGHPEVEAGCLSS